MKIRITLYSLVFFALFLLTYICPPFLVNGVSPQLLFCGVLALTIFEKERFGSAYAIIFGLLADFASGILFGTNTVFFILLVFACALLYTKLLSVNVLTYYISCTVLLLLEDIVYFAFCSVFSDTSDFGLMLYHVTLPKILITLPFIFLIYFVFKKIASKREWRPYHETEY